jgi:hypothetical protein
MNYFLAIYLGISLITVFTNSPIKAFAVEINSDTEISYVEYANYNLSQKHFQEVSNPLAIKKQELDIQKQNEAQESLNRQQQELQRQQQIAIKKKKTKTKPKVAVNTNFTKPTTAPSGSVESLIYHWTSVYGGDPGYHVKIARCESGLNPNSVGGGGLYLGVYQQHSKYWAARAARYGFAGASPFDANANVAVSIAMMRGGMYSHWGCA